MNCLNWINMGLRRVQLNSFATGKVILHQTFNRNVSLVMDIWPITFKEITFKFHCIDIEVYLGLKGFTELLKCIHIA